MTLERIDAKYYRNVAKRMQEIKDLPRPRPRLLTGYPIIYIPSGEDEQQ